MKRVLVINQEVGLRLGFKNFTELAIFSLLGECQAWATIIEHEGVHYYWCSRTKLKESLPLLNLKNDTVYRILKRLRDELNVILYTKKGKQDLIKLTDLGKSYYYVGNNSEKENNSYVGKFSESRQNSEKNPKNRQKNSEKNPTDTKRSTICNVHCTDFLMYKDLYWLKTVAFSEVDRNKILSYFRKYNLTQEQSQQVLDEGLSRIASQPNKVKNHIGFLSTLSKKIAEDKLKITHFGQACANSRNSTQTQQSRKQDQKRQEVFNQLEAAVRIKGTLGKPIPETLIQQAKEYNLSIKGVC